MRVKQKIKVALTPFIGLSSWPLKNGVPIQISI